MPDELAILLPYQRRWIADRSQVAVLRLTDGTVEIGYAIAEALEIVTLPPDMARALERHNALFGTADLAFLLVQASPGGRDTLLA